MMMVDEKMKTVAVIGFGRFGQMVAEVLSQCFEVYAYNPRDKSKIAKELGIKFEPSLEKAAGKDIVILSMPISCLCDVLRDIAPHLKPGALVLDVCSVKEKPAMLMKKMLPKDVDIVATHPLFGPSVKVEIVKGKTVYDIADKKIVLCPVRTKKLDVGKLKGFLEELGLVVYITTPAEHDRQMAIAQGLTHYIALALRKMGVGEQDLTTPNFDALIGIIKRLDNDTDVLLKDIQVQNKYASEQRNIFRKTLDEVEKDIDGCQNDD
ncbi:MAG: prephenate dehydrogenase/arogenate dehydrogenase family protein [archaeon]